MIVKDEAHVIRRCLKSVRPFIDCWVIVDTGSSDGTQDIIRDEMQGVPGKLYERPWKDFGHNRTEALQLARTHADFIFTIDADEVLEFPESYIRPKLKDDAYLINVRQGGTDYGRLCLVSTKLNWKYVGVLHEYLTADGPFDRTTLPGPVVRYFEMEGGRSKGLTTAEKYLRDAETLQRALRVEPDNSRYIFYLAQSYRDAGDLNRALEVYAKRATMGGWDEEVWYSLLQVARLSERLQLDYARVVERYLNAFQNRPIRAEPLVDLARYHREQKRYAVALIFARRAIEIKRPPDILFVEAASYEWRALDELAIASYWTEAYGDCAQACDKLLNSVKLPDDQRQRILANRKFALDRLLKNDPAAKLRARGPLGHTAN